VIVDHPDGLHKRVADGRAHELEAARLEVPAQRVGFGRSVGNFLERSPPVPFGLAADESPEIGVKAPELFLNGEKRLRVGDRGGDLEPVPNDPRIGEQLAHFAPIVCGDSAGLKIVEGGAIAVPFFQDGLPGEPRLRPPG